MCLDRDLSRSVETVDRDCEVRRDFLFPRFYYAIVKASSFSIHPSTHRSVSNPFHNSRFRDEHAHNRDSSDKIRRSGRGDCLSSRREYCALDCSLSAVIISKSWYQGKYRNASWRECSAYRRYSEMAVDVSAMASHGPRDRPPIAIIDKNGGRTIRPPDISPIFLSLASFNVQFDLIDKLNISSNNFK